MTDSPRGDARPTAAVVAEAIASGGYSLLRRASDVPSCPECEREVATNGVIVHGLLCSRGPTTKPLAERPCTHPKIVNTWADTYRCTTCQAAYTMTDDTLTRDKANDDG